MASRTAHKLKLRATAAGGSCCWGLCTANYARNHAHAHTHSTGQQVVLLLLLLLSLSLAPPPVRLHLTATLIFPMLSGCATRLSQLQFLLLFVPQPDSRQALHVCVCVCHMGVPHACVVFCVRHKCQFKLAANETRLSYPHKHIRVGAIEMPTAAFGGAAQRGAPVLLLHAANKLQPRTVCLHTPLFLSLSLLLCPEGIYNQSEGRQRFYFMRVIYVNCKYFNKLPFAAPPATRQLPTANCHVPCGTWCVRHRAAFYRH